MLSVVPPAPSEASYAHGSKSTYTVQAHTVKPEPSKPPPEPRTVDELMRSRSQTDPELPLVSYPSSGIEYVDYTARQLDTFAYRAAKKYASALPSRASSLEKPIVVGLLGPSNLDYLITFLALSKLGHSVMFLSTRIAQEAHASLLSRTESHHMVIHPSFAEMGSALQKDMPDLQLVPMITRDVYDFPLSEPIDTKISSQLDSAIETSNVCWIIHSSGSTGLPKPIFITQKAALKNYSTNMNMRGFITLPLYHAHGICSLFRAIDSKKQIHLYNADLPLAKQYLIDIIRSHDFEIFYGVPYVLNLLAETPEGIDLLSRFKIVMFGGSSCPDSLGHKLVAHDVNLVSHYGSTETGQLMTSFRPAGDDGWDYLRPSAAVKPYVRFEERGEGLYECVCLDGWPSKVMTNREDGAYTTKDCFTKHPTLPDAWKYYCRLDDTITLNNGEKANPLQLEGATRACPYVTEAVMFGAGKARIGVALVLSAEAVGISEDAIIDAVFETIAPAHAALPAYAKIDRDMVLLLPPETQYRATDKGTIIRQAFYKQFSQEIEAMYEEKTAGTLALSETELGDFVRKEVVQVMELKDPSSISDDQDFFNLGMDSLQTTRLRSTFLKELNLGGKQLGLNCVFDYPSIAALAHHLYSLRTGADAASVSKEEEMQALIEKYSVFQEHIPQPRTVQGEYILLTGTTGSLGAHIAAQLSLRPTVQKLYCLIRAPSHSTAHTRLVHSLETRRLWPTLPAAAQAKLIALPADLSRADLGLAPAELEELRTNLSAAVHCAWAVNFNRALRSFDDCVAGTRNLLNLCLAARAPAPASFTFCSSVSAVAASASLPSSSSSSSSSTASSEVVVPEALPPALSAAQNMGYAQSKLVAEHVCLRAAASSSGSRLAARVLRVGQIVGDTEHGVWSATEAIPLMLRTAVGLGVLPALDEGVRWLPVDGVAGVCVDVGVGVDARGGVGVGGEGQEEEEEKEGKGREEERAAAPSGVYNVVNPYAIHWTRELLPLLRASGLQFETVSVGEWLERLRASEQDPAKNPPVKLVEFWEKKYGDVVEAEKEGEGSVVKRPELVYETEKVRQWSSTMAAVGKPDEELLRKIVGYFLSEGWKDA